MTAKEVWETFKDTPDWEIYGEKMYKELLRRESIIVPIPAYNITRNAKAKKNSRPYYVSSADIWEMYPDKRAKEWKEVGLKKYLELRKMEIKNNL